MRDEEKTYDIDSLLMFHLPETGPEACSFFFSRETPIQLLHTYPVELVEVVKRL
jgi:hypothetical protein